MAWAVLYTLALTQPLVPRDPPWVLRQSEQFLLGARRSAQNRVLAWELLGLLVVRSLEQPARSGVSWSFRASGIAGERAEAPTMRQTPVEQSQGSGSRA